MASLLDDSRKIVVDINSASKDLATLEVLPNNSKSKSSAKKLLKEAQLNLAILINRVDDLA